MRAALLVALVVVASLAWGRTRNKLFVPLTTSTTTTLATTTSTSTTTTVTTSTTTTTLVISCTALTHGLNATTQSAYTTASVSPTANHLILLALQSTCNGFCTPDEAPSSISTTTNLTFTSVDTVPFSTSGSGNNWWRLNLYQASSATPGTGTVTINFTHTQFGAAWAVIDCTNTTTIVQHVTASNTALSTALAATLAAFAHPNDLTLALLGGNDNLNATMTPGTGFSMLYTADADGGRFLLFGVETKTNEVNVTATQAAAREWGVIAIELGP